MSSMSGEDQPSWLEQIKICYQRIPSIEEDPELQVPASNLAIAAGHVSGPFELAIGHEKFWSVGQTLKVSWWKGDGQTATDSLKRRVKQAAKQWDAICNINFDFGDYGEDADIRVAFLPKQGSWSYVGRDCYAEKRSKPTMNFGWLNDSSSDEAIHSVVLHEFGHALGCIHEHQNPDVGIKWNVDLVEKVFSGPPNKWDKTKIHRNILDPVSTSMNSVFDPDSIMLYAYPAELTLDGKGTHENKELSAMDKNFIRKVYPPHAHDDGFFDTGDLAPKTPASDKGEVASSQLPGFFNTKQVDFSPSYKSPPKIAIGLSRIDMACKANKAVAATVDQVTADSAQVSVSTWDTSVLNGGAATWVSAEATNSQWQFGEFNTQEQRDRNDTSSQTAEKVIYFEESYNSPPAVVVALKLIDLENHKDYRAKAYASDIYEDRFTLHIDTWGDSILYAGAASWIAYPADLKSTISGSLSTKENAAKTTQRFTFPKGKFVKKPTVRIFLNMIDVKCGTDLRIKTWVDQITQNGLDWHADTWKDTVLRQAGVSILAWA